MASGERNETRAFARLPNLDIAIIHRGAQDHEGEQIMIAFRAAPSLEPLGRLIGPADPLLFWMRLSQMAWNSWLGCLAAATPPWIRRGE
ncbi:hypothetical protein [Siccirubricoccus sp. G192]|uniref:hypothetical protein n=1 Tax=Siccirubricoccus sp. G192 TaxID=2849651 RepID=UPI001C2C3825|nr:hypothetical protein [Siccirubricoccus sp. G192]MBV1798670.1 hypothetical protein [Siccirubricoccus sp. G192]